MSARSRRRQRLLAARFGWQPVGRWARGTWYRHTPSGTTMLVWVDDITGAYDTETKGLLP